MLNSRRCQSCGEVNGLICGAACENTSVEMKPKAAAQNSLRAAKCMVEYSAHWGIPQPQTRTGLAHPGTHPHSGHCVRPKPTHPLEKITPPSLLSSHPVVGLRLQIFPKQADTKEVDTKE
jgi:hypothetical protein